MKSVWEHFLQFVKDKEKWIRIVIPSLVLGCFFFFIMLSNVYTETYEIERFNNAKETIRSPITIENTKETDRKIREAIQAVDDRYDVSSVITQERVDYVNELFDAIEKQQEEIDAAQEEEVTVGENEENQYDSSVPLTNQERVQSLQQVLSPSITDDLSQEVLLSIVEASPRERSLGQELLTTSLYEVLNEGVRTDEVQTAVQSVNQKLRYSSIDEQLKEALYSLTKFAVVENSFYDVEKTNEAQKQAISNVEPVMIRAGEVIVREGQTITNEIYEELALVGLLDSDRNSYPVIGLIIFIILLLGIIVYEINKYAENNRLDNRKIASILLISLLTVGMMKLISIYTTPVNQLFLLVPVATATMLLKILLYDRLAIVLGIVYAVMGSVIFNAEIPGSLNMEACIYLLFSQLAGIIFLYSVKDRTAILKAGLGITVINILTVLIFLLLSFEKYSIYESFLLVGFGITSAFLASVLTIGMLPFFEAGLGILSDTKLLTLSSPNQPLLRKLLTEAPGTYHHSVMVANLSEACCESIGANGLLARVAAYYHDLGKTVRPHYFIENQMGIRNPHDFIEPKQSAEIIINHPYDGSKMLKKHKLPKEIIDIAEQHHGTTLLKYFYYKDKDKNKAVNEADYRYPGPKPRTKEAAIICICDSIEAAVRSLKEPTNEKINEIVTSIINDRLMDGQLSESSLTFRELETIQQAICETLNGIFHSRIQYPTSKEVKEAN
ncbi:HD family phosphohydrolase [Aquibacillus albus]|uniref:Nucleotidyltransferase with HDIG domain n=1 Tax=Aquibacillus albus TaxID=1168171 RepID=A0ABS2MUX3_9BACI|nr:HDIG domain-containing metalloprotein [Aquibacillus albus]MBM7569628.1 putative nucleotidyltransferase with HDIG domain [Aquibacillus albus]